MKLNNGLLFKEIEKQLKNCIDFTVKNFEEDFLIQEVSPIESYTKDSLVFINNKKKFAVPKK